MNAAIEHRAMRVALAVALNFWASSTLAAAPAPTAQLSYARGAGAEKCPDEASLERGVAALLGRDPFDSKAERRIRVAVETTPAGLTAHFELFDRAGRRLGRRDLSSNARDCRELASAMNLALAVAIDPVAALAARPEPAPEPAATPATPVPVPVTPPVTETKYVVREVEVQVPRADQGMQVGLGVRGAIGADPSLSFGVFVEGSRRWSVFSVGLSVDAGLPVQTALFVGRMTSWRLGASVLPCGHVSVFFGCLRLSAGAQIFSGERLDDAQTVTTFSSAVGPRVGVEIKALPNLAVRLSVEAALTLSRYAVKVSRMTVWETPTVFGMAAVGVYYLF